METGNSAKLALVMIALLFFVGCSEPPRKLPGLYSDPKSGRLLDVGPKGMFALKEIRHVVVGHWNNSTADELKLDFLSFPKRGDEKNYEFRWTKPGFRLDTEASEHYEEFLSESLEDAPDGSLVGLWRHENDDFLEFTEYTPWGTVIWFRKAKYQQDQYVGGGWARYSITDHDQLTIDGMEYTLSVIADNQFTFQLSGSLLTLRSKKLKWQKKYIKVEPSDLRETLESAQPMAKPQPTQTP